jgi:hypothetical protein
MKLPDVALRMHGPDGSVDTITLKKPQSKLFAFRPCYVEPPGLPADFYVLNNIKCPEVSGYVGKDGLFDFEETPSYPLKWDGPSGEEGEVDPLCLWSTVYQWETNPSSIYIGFDDPCWLHYPPGELNNQYTDLYVYIVDEWPPPAPPPSGGGGFSIPSMATETEVELGAPMNIRIDMEKGKRLDPKLMPDNVGSQGKAGTSMVMGVGALGAAFGDPRSMIKDLQDTAAGGQTNAPLNANMRLFASKFGWVNMGFLNPPPTWLVDVVVPAEARTPRRRMQAVAEAMANTTDGEDWEDDDGGNPAGDLPDPNESGNAGFLRKGGVSADEFFVGTILGVLLVPLVMVTLQPPFVEKYSQLKNSTRTKILEKRSLAMKYEQFHDIDPSFDEVLDTMPEYQVPEKFSKSSVLLGILTLQTAGICQCALMAIFEAEAATTVLAAVVAMVCFPVFFIFYTYVTLRAVMQPDAVFPEWFPKVGSMLYWDVAKNVFKSIPPDMEPGDVMFVPSIPPELLEKPIPVKPLIPPGTGPEDAKQIVEEAAQAFKEQIKARLAGIKKLGPDALTLQGKWVAKGAGEKFMAVYGQQMANYTQTGFILVTFEMVKKLLMLTCLAGLSTAPDLGPLQIKILTLLGWIELVVVIIAKPFAQITVNYTVPAAFTTKLLQMVAPILLGMKLVEDQVSTTRHTNTHKHTRACMCTIQCDAQSLTL